MAKKLLSSKANYVSKRMINELEVERNGKTTYIDGADLIDGMYVKKGVKFAKGSTIKGGMKKYKVFTKDDLHEYVSDLPKYKYKNFCDEYGIDVNDGEEMQNFINSITPEQLEEIKKDINDNVWGYKLENGGGVAVSSESGLAVGTNADLLMNQQNLQYAHGGGVGEMIQTNGNSGWIYANSGQGFNDLESAKNYADKLSNERVRQSELGRKEAVDVIVVKEHNGKYNVIYREKNYAKLQPNLVERVYAKGSTVKGKKTFATLYPQIVNAIMLNYGISKEKAESIVDENETWLTDMIEYYEETSPSHLSNIIMDTDEGKYAKGSTVKGEDKGLTDDELITMIENNLDERYEDEEDYFIRAYDLGFRREKSTKLWFQTKEYAKGGGLSNSKYIPNRMVQSVEVERKGKTTDIDGADILDGFRVKKGVKFAKGGNITSDTFLKKEWSEYTKEARVNTLVEAGYSKSVAKDLSLENWSSLEKKVQNGFRNSLLAEEIENMKGMMNSIYTYGSLDKNSYSYEKYLLPYKETLGKKLFDKIYEEEYENLQGYEIEHNVGTDAEGVTYNSLKKKKALGGFLLGVGVGVAGKYAYDKYGNKLQGKGTKKVASKGKKRKYEEGGLVNWGGTAESSQEGMLIGGTNAELTSNQYGKGGGVEIDKFQKATIIPKIQELHKGELPETLKYNNLIKLSVSDLKKMYMDMGGNQYRHGGSMGGWCYSIGGL